MSVLKENYDRIISELEEKITNPEDLEFVKKKVSELSLMFMDVIDAYTETTEDRLKIIEDKQKQIEKEVYPNGAEQGLGQRFYLHIC